MSSVLGAHTPRRLRSTASPEALGASYSALAARHGPGFCSYADESEHVAAATLVKTGRGSIFEQANQDCVRETWKVGGGNLVVSKATMTTALGIVLNDHQPRWGLSEAEKSDFVTTLRRRLRNLCRVARQGLLRTPQAPWVKALKLGAVDSLPERETGHAHATDAEASAEAVGGESKPVVKPGSSSAADYTFAFSRELMLPTRSLRGVGKPEPGLPPGNGPANAEVRALFHDGMSAVIPGFTHAKLKLLCREGAAKHAALGSFFETEHHESRHKLSVQQRVDRKLLMVVMEQEKQILQVNMDLWGEIADQHRQQPLDHPCTIGAGEFMQGLCMDCARGALTRAALKDERNARLAALGKGGLRTGAGSSRAAAVMRRPAAVDKATVDSAAAQPTARKHRRISWKTPEARAISPSGGRDELAGALGSTAAGATRPSRDAAGLPSASACQLNALTTWVPPPPTLSSLEELLAWTSQG